MNRKIVFLVLVLFFLFGCIEQKDIAKTCVTDVDCKFIPEGCFAGCWNRDYNPLNGEDCDTSLPLDTICICENSSCVEVAPSEQETPVEVKIEEEEIDVKSCAIDNDCQLIESGCKAGCWNKNLVLKEKDELCEISVPSNYYCVCENNECVGLSKSRYEQREQELNPLDPCAGTFCEEGAKCVKGKCVYPTCEELGGFECGPGLICESDLIEGKGLEECCSVECTSIEFPTSIGYQEGDVVPYIRFVDKDEVFHEIPLAIILEHDSRGVGNFLSVDGGPKYYYEASLDENIFFVKNGDILNGKTIDIESITPGVADIAGYPAVVAVRDLDIFGIDLTVLDVQANNAVKFRSIGSMFMCNWKETPSESYCKGHPSPFEESVYHTLFLNSQNVFESKWHRIVLEGKNGLRISYVPLLVKSPRKNAFYLLFDDQHYFDFETFAGENIIFEGTDTDGDGIVSKYEPQYLAIDSLWVMGQEVEWCDEPLHAVFRVVEESGVEDVVRIPTDIDCITST